MVLWLFSLYLLYVYIVVWFVASLWGLWNSVCPPCDDFGPSFTPIEMPVGPVVAHLAPKCLSLGSLWLPSGSSGRMPLSPFGAPCLPELIPELIPELPMNYQSYFERLRCLCIKNGLVALGIISELSRNYPELSRQGGPKWNKRRSSQPHFTRAGGQDDVSLEQTPSNYVIEPNV